MNALPLERALSFDTDHAAGGTETAGAALKPPLAAISTAPMPTAQRAERTARTVTVPWALLLHRVKTGLPMFALSALSLGLFIAGWYFATKYRIDWYIRFTNIPTPGEVLSELRQLSQSNVFYTNMWISIRRIVLGFGIATALGIGLGLLIGRYKVARGLLFSTLEVLRPIPAIAWVPMSIMLWPTNETSIVFITFLGSFFPILLNTMHGVNAVDPVLLRAARSLGASEWSVMRLVTLKGALPHIFTGLAVGMGVAWVSLIAAEMISGQFGIGYFTWEAYSLVEYSHVVIGMLLIGVLGLICSGLIRFLGVCMMPWIKNPTGDLKS